MADEQGAAHQLLPGERPGDLDPSVAALVVAEQPVARAVDHVRSRAPRQVLPQVRLIGGDVARELGRVVRRQRAQPQLGAGARGEGLVDQPAYVYRIGSSRSSRHHRPALIGLHRAIPPPGSSPT